MPTGCNILRLSPDKQLELFLQGMKNWQTLFALSGQPAAGAAPVGCEAFVAGRNVAITPGKIIFRNRLIEVIQYAPAIAEVYPEPILIMSAWIMKYYILDLSPANSLVRHLVENGYTVFVISWKNPTGDDRDLSFDDYRRLGFMAALTLFLNNALAEGRFVVDGRPISLRDIRVPIFAVSTVTDHVAPWRSVYKIAKLTGAEITFVLSNGGHNVGVVNPPGTPHRQYQLAVHADAAASVDGERWAAAAPVHQGSWWPAWMDWLVRHSGTRGPTPVMGAPAAGYAALGDAPGTYVFER
jgi:poly(3-hydroxyalkanoate) synthetase